LKLLGYFGRGRMIAKGTMRTTRATDTATKMIIIHLHRLVFLGGLREILNSFLASAVAAVSSIEKIVNGKRTKPTLQFRETIRNGGSNLSLSRGVQPRARNLLMVTLVPTAVKFAVESRIGSLRNFPAGYFVRSRNTNPP
jgi:hypothetical protein